MPDKLVRPVAANIRSPRLRMTAEGRPYARFRRALDIRSVMQAETAAREMGRLGLNDALDYLVLLAAEAPDRYDRAARKWLARLLNESSALTLDEVAWRSAAFAEWLPATGSRRGRCYGRW